MPKPAALRPQHHRRGYLAERIAAIYLQCHGLRLITRNYRCRFGEIDLIMQHQRSLVFVEVRLRARGRHADAAASVTAKKQVRLARAAQHYLAAHRNDCVCRFDVVAFQHPWWPYAWVRGAFNLDG